MGGDKARRSARSSSKGQGSDSAAATTTTTTSSSTPSASMLRDTKTFYWTLGYFIRTQGDFTGCPYLSEKEDLPVKIHLFGLYLDLFLWDTPHYRAPTYRHDILANLCNVAIPGTGVPLSFFCYLKISAYFLILLLYPLLCFLGAYNVGRKEPVETRWDVVSKAYTEHLLSPQDWFVFWRLNSRLAAYHELMTNSPGYKMEDKWTFLVEGEKLGVPVSPYLRVSSIVVKNKNEEGGLGIFFYKNALVGGDWIIQERLDNSDFVKLLLPNDAPLSTLRIITASRGGLTPKDPRKGCPPSAAGFDSAPPNLVEALSCVFRAGRQGASTDHSSILFDVDVKTGIMKEGSTNAHWYQLGPMAPFRTPWRSTYQTDSHPDNHVKVMGTVIEDIDDLLKLVRQAHFTLLPDVPLVGWDVCLTSRGVFLLEVNLSCNFFRGSFDRDKYYSFMNDYFVMLDKMRKEEEEEGDKKTR